MKLLAKIPGTAAEQEAALRTVNALLPTCTPMQAYAIGAASYHAWTAGMQPTRNLFELTMAAAAQGGIDQALRVIQGWIGGKKRPRR